MLISKEKLIDVWNSTPEHLRPNFIEFIKCAPAVNAIPTDKVTRAIKEMEAVGDAECQMSGPTATQWAEKCINILRESCTRR